MSSLSIVKGKTFERTCANLLTKKLGVKWNRVPNSGAMQTAQKIEDPRFKGDLFSDNEQFKEMVIECKITKKPLKIDDLLMDDSIIWKWWAQTEEEAGLTNSPILVFKYRGSQIYIITFMRLLISKLGCKELGSINHLGKAFFIGVLE